MRRFKICNGREYWNNELGWVDQRGATVFKEKELINRNFHLPLDTKEVCWLELTGTGRIVNRQARKFFPYF